MEYRVVFYTDSKGRCPVIEYLDGMIPKDRAKVLKYIDLLLQNKGILDEPFSRHIKGKIRELRVDFQNRKHRILYFTFVNRNIVLLHAFLKKTNKTPVREIAKAEVYLSNIINNPKKYE